MPTLRIKHFILIIPISALLHLSIHLLVFPERSSEKSNAKHTTTFKEFYIQKLRTELSNKKELEKHFTPYLLVKGHEKHAERLEESGYSRKYLDKLFKEWFYEKFGLVYKKDSIIKHSSNKYIIKIKNRKKHRSHIVEKNDQVQIFIEKDQIPSKKTINSVRSIVIPNPGRFKYNVIKKSTSTFEVKPEDL